MYKDALFVQTDGLQSQLSMRLLTPPPSVATNCKSVCVCIPTSVTYREVGRGGHEGAAAVKSTWFGC